MVQLTALLAFGYDVKTGVAKRRLYIQYRFKLHGF